MSDAHMTLAGAADPGGVAATRFAVLDSPATATLLDELIAECVLEAMEAPGFDTGFKDGLMFSIAVGALSVAASA
ncbi:hypothetical protein [Streptomyces sp. NBC_00467]|uniref:hypothetical protein n=1 Tax=Streptomyces sp. NBC_00467 TaxID=2975752 RepID=UPI002E1772CE